MVNTTEQEDHSPKITQRIQAFTVRLNKFANYLKDNKFEQSIIHTKCEEFMSERINKADRYLIRRIMLSNAISDSNLVTDFKQIVATELPSTITQYRGVFTKYMSDILNNGKSVLESNPDSFDNPTEHMAALYAFSKDPGGFGIFNLINRHKLFKIEGLGTYANFVEAYISSPPVLDKLDINDLESIREFLKKSFDEDLKVGGVIFEAMHVSINAFKQNETEIYGKGPYILSKDALEIILSLEDGMCPAYLTMTDGSRRRIVSVLTEMFIDCIPDQVIQNLMLSWET